MLVMAYQLWHIRNRTGFKTTTLLASSGSRGLALSLSDCPPTERSVQVATHSLIECSIGCLDSVAHRLFHQGGKHVMTVSFKDLKLSAGWSGLSASLDVYKKGITWPYDVQPSLNWFAPICTQYLVGHRPTQL